MDSILNTELFFSGSYSQLLQLAPPAKSVIITDDKLYALHGALFAEHRTFIVASGEAEKTLATIGRLAEKLAAAEIHRNAILVGVGGGVITDITGFLASVYMRGTRLGFVPTSILAMADAAVGGKNGVNMGLYKNMLGSVRQPEFVLFDHSLPDTLPHEEWINGFAEIIKYACIGSKELWLALEARSITAYKTDKQLCKHLIEQCVRQKMKIVAADEHENNLRKILNFGHTAGHAFETLYHLKHGQAVGLGMLFALILSEQELQLSPDIRPRLAALLQQYGLPVRLKMEPEKVMQVLRRDKKRAQDEIDFILLPEVGEAIIRPLSFETIAAALNIFAHEYRP